MELYDLLSSHWSLPVHSPLAAFRVCLCDQTGGCGGFGKGNFTELFKSIEDYERVLDGSAKLTEKNVVVAADEAAAAVAKP
jgi:hypothetical protein